MIRSINCYVCFCKRVNGWDKLKNAKANKLDRRKDVNKLFPSPLFEPCLRANRSAQFRRRSNTHRRKNKRSLLSRYRRTANTKESQISRWKSTENTFLVEPRFVPFSLLQFSLLEIIKQDARNTPPFDSKRLESLQIRGQTPVYRTTTIRNG